MRRSLLAIGTAAGALMAPSVASATTFMVDAFTNSSGGGVGLATGVMLTAGQGLTVSADPADLWNAGPLPRWSNANGLTGNLYAVAGDDSGAAAGTLIGQNFGTFTANGLTAPYGALVGSIGGVFKLLGTSFNGPAWNTGELSLYYWDSNNGDNSESVAVDVSAAVPEPGTWALMMVGFAVVGFGLRRRTATETKVSYNFA